MSVSFTRPPGVQFENSFNVSISFDEEVSGLDQTELTLTENTAGANVTSWKALMGWTGNNTVTQYSAKVEVTQSGTVTFSVAGGVATDGSGNSNADAVSKSVTVTITLTDYPPWDVNEDGSVDATDSALVTAALGQTGEAIVNERTDVNWDETVDTDDLTLVTYHIETDVDEHRAPAFDTESTTRSVAENTGSDVSIGTAVSATDADDDDTLTYTLGGTDAAACEIDSTNGQLRTKSALDYETKTSYSVAITASDGKKSDSITVTINVTDVDENRAPTFSGSSISYSITDIANASVGDSIGLPITATDLDDDTLEYSLGGDDASKFTIDSGSGQLKITQVLIDGIQAPHTP